MIAILIVGFRFDGDIHFDAPAGVIGKTSGVVATVIHIRHSISVHAFFPSVAIVHAATLDRFITGGTIFTATFGAVHADAIADGRADQRSADHGDRIASVTITDMTADGRTDQAADQSRARDSARTSVVHGTILVPALPL